MRTYCLMFQDRYKQFRHWQRQPYAVRPRSEEEHDCPTCATRYRGNYCPTCGQPAVVGRYSARSALMQFLDVWGMGNRGMFHTLRDLLLRPGYMIRDYLSGMQMAYFPPFKMFFVLTTISLLVAHGFNIRMQSQIDTDAAEPVAAVTSVNSRIDRLVERAETFQDQYPNLFGLCMVMLLSAFLFPLLRHSPAVPDMRYSELIVALIYTANMYSLWTIVFDFLCLDDAFEDVALALMLIPLHQYCGYSWAQLLFRILTAFILLFLVLVLGIRLCLVL